MTKLRTLVLLAVALCVPAVSAVAATKQTLTPEQAQTIDSALNDLGMKADRVLDMPNGQNVPVQTVYDFGKDGSKVAMAIAKNRIALQPALERYGAECQSLISEIWGKEVPTKDDPRQAIFRDRIKAKAKATFEVELEPIPLAALQIDPRLPANVLVALRLIIPELSPLQGESTQVARK